MANQQSKTLQSKHLQICAVSKTFKIYLEQHCEYHTPVHFPTVEAQYHEYSVNCNSLILRAGEFPIHGNVNEGNDKEGRSQR